MAIKEEKMIKSLISINDYVNIDKLCAECGISRRTFYNYVKNLRNDPDFVVSIKNNSILLSAINSNTKINESDYSIDVPEDYYQRKNWLFRKGLFLQRELDIEEVIDYFQISDATFHSDLIKIRKELSKYHVKLITKKGKLVFLGNYHDIKKLTQHIIFEENNANNSLLSTDSLNEIFPNLDAKFIKRVIQNELNKQNLFMDEYSIINLLLHVLISTNQEINGIKPRELVSGNIHVCELINNICKQIEQKYNFNFSSSSKHKFALIINTRTKIDDSLDGESFRHTSTETLVNEIIRDLYAFFNVDFSTGTFKELFALHLDSLLTRLEEGIILHNPLFNSIKQTSPMTYDIAVFVSNIISKETGFNIGEGEISYIALHVGTKIEEQRSARTKLKVILVCPEFYLYKLNLDKITCDFNDDIYITNVYTSYDDVSTFNDIDLVICTILPSKPIKDVTLIKVSVFFSNVDKLKLMNLVTQIKKDKRVNHIRKLVTSIFRKELFNRNVIFSTRDEAIKSISQQLIKNGYVDENYCDSVINRENIAPTDYGILAIPHPVDYLASETIISVTILDKPLFWGRNEVSIIFMIAINNKDIEVFEDVLSSIIEMNEDDSKIRKLITSDSYEYFVNQFIDILSNR